MSVNLSINISGSEPHPIMDLPDIVAKKFSFDAPTDHQLVRILDHEP